MSTDTAPKTPRPQAKALTHTEENILNAVGDMGVATAKDVTRLLFKPGSLPYTRRLMTELAGGGDFQPAEYLVRYGMPHAPGNFERYYSLGKRGVQYFRSLGRETNCLYQPRKTGYSFSFLKHHHAIAQCLVALNLFVRKTPGFQLIETRPWFALAADPPCLTYWTDGQETTISPIPDAFVYLERQGKDPSTIQGFGLWFEIDRGTETKAKFQNLILDRINFIRYKGYEAYFDTSSVLLLYLAVGPTTDYRLARLHTMREWTMEVLTENLSDWSPVFRFSTIDESLYDTLMLFTDPVFYLPDSDELVTLFPPPQDKEETHGHKIPAEETRANP